ESELEVRGEQAVTLDLVVRRPFGERASVAKGRARERLRMLDIEPRVVALRRIERVVRAVDRSRDAERRQPLVAAQGDDREWIADAEVHAKVHVSGFDLGELEMVVGREGSALRELVGEREIAPEAAIDEHIRRALAMGEQTDAERVARRH